MRNRRKEERKEGVMYKQKGKMEREEKTRVHVAHTCTCMCSMVIRKNGVSVIHIGMEVPHR